MKIKQDFVTNSSSTSFIISTKDALTQESFLKALGVEGDSPMNQLFEQLFDAVDGNRTEITEYMKSSGFDCTAVPEFLQSEGFCTETIEAVEQLINTGRTVYIGELSSSGSSAAEVFFCCESFLASDDSIYFNGRISGW